MYYILELEDSVLTITFTNKETESDNCVFRLINDDFSIDTPGLGVNYKFDQYHKGGSCHRKGQSWVKCCMGCSHHLLAIVVDF